MFITVDGLKLHYEEYNDASLQSVLLVHGWGADINTLRPVINLLKHDYHVIALDLPGHGESEAPHEVIGTEGFADCVERFMSIKALTSPIYIGHSFGGKTGICLAAGHKNIFSKLVLVDASGIREELKLGMRLKVKLFKLKKKLYTLVFGERSLERFYKKYGSEDYRTADGIMRKILVKVVNEDLTDRLENIDIPTLLFWGNNDDATPVRMGEKMAQCIKNSRLVVTDGGHYSYLDDMNTFRKTLLDFLSEV